MKPATHPKQSKRPKKTKKPKEPKLASADPLYDVPTLPQDALVRDIDRLLQYTQVTDHAREQIHQVLNGDHQNNIDMLGAVERRIKFAELLDSLLSAPLSPDTGLASRYFLHQLIKQLSTSCRSTVLSIFVNEALSQALLDLFSALSPEADLSQVVAVLEKVRLRRIGDIELFHSHVAEIHILAQAVRNRTVKSHKKFRRKIWTTTREVYRFVDRTSESTILPLTIEFGHQGYLRLVSPTIQAAANLTAK